MGDYDKRMTFARRISERREMSSKAASQKFPFFSLHTHKNSVYAFPFSFPTKVCCISTKKPKARFPFSQQAKKFPNKPKKSSIRGRE